MRTNRHAESQLDRETRARALGAFFGAGAVVTTAVIALPGWDRMHVAGLAATVVAAAMGSLCLYVFASGLSRGMIHAFTVAGTVLIAASQVFARGGSPTAMYAMLYIWVILHCSLFFSRAVIVGHFALTTLAHAAALIWLGETSAIAPHLALTLVTQVSAALVVGALAARQRELADTDPLTGLGNRRVAERALEWAQAMARRHPGMQTCVALFDLDGFKALNDEQGHAAGDAVLVELAAAWRRSARGSDTLTRTGGDEFLLVLVECDITEAERVVRRMIADTPDGVSCSAGLARWDHHETATHLIERADRALYTAKARGPVSIAPDHEPAATPYMV